MESPNKKLIEPVRDHLENIFESGPNYWKSVDYLAERLGEIQSLAAEEIGTHFRWRIKEFLQIHTKFGPLEMKVYAALTEVEKQWSLKSAAEDEKKHLEWDVPFYRVKP